VTCRYRCLLERYHTLYSTHQLSCAIPFCAGIVISADARRNTSHLVQHVRLPAASRSCFRHSPILLLELMMCCCRCLLERYHTLYSLSELLQSCPACRKACACNSCLRDATSADELVPPLQPEPMQHARQAEYVLRELAPHLADMLKQQETEVRMGSAPSARGSGVGAASP
jgi:hypothetical protein